MSEKGKYYRRIRTSLLGAASVFALLSIIIFIVLIMNMNKDRLNSQRFMFSNQLNIVNIADFYLSQKTVETKLLDNWADSEVGTNYRYYHALQLYKILSSSSNKLESIVSSTSVLSLFPDDMVITSRGTCSLEYFFQNYTNLEKTDSLSVISLLEDRQEKVTILSVYDNDILTDLYICRPYFSLNGNYLLIFTRLYVSSFFNFPDKQYAYLISPDRNVIYLNRSEDSRMILIEKIDDIMRTPEDSSGKNGFYWTMLADMTTRFVCFYPPDNTAMFLSLLWGMAFVIFSLFIYALVYRQAGILYNPISNVVSQNCSNVIIDKNTDEMAIIKDRNEMLLRLSHELRKANEDMLVYAKASVYRSILDGTISPDRQEKCEYYVALIRINGAEDIAWDVASLKLFLQSKESDSFHSVSFGMGRLCFFFRCADDSLAKNVLLSVVHEIPDTVSYVTTLSDMVVGQNNLKFAFQQCNKLMEYASSLHMKNIITSKDIPDFNRFGNFDYSVEDEMVLMNLALSGKNAAKNEFERIVAKNIGDDKLSMDAKLSFCYGMLSTMARIFSALKTTPEQLIGRKVDFAILACENNCSLAISRIRDIFYGIVDAVERNVCNSDKKLLHDMKEFIHFNYQKNIGLQDLADKLSITPKYCGMLFSKLSNDTFTNYLNQYRIDIAKYKIEENPSIKIQDLGQMVGFNSPQNFIRVFGKYTGMSPGAYAEHIYLRKQEK